MRPGVFLTLMPVPVAAAIYTASFGLWLLRRGNLRGAVGVFVLAASCILTPLIFLAIRG